MICKTCETEKPEVDFYIRSCDKKRNVHCKECYKGMMAMRRELQREILATKQKEYRKRKPEVCANAAKNWSDKNREKIREYNRQYYRDNHENERRTRNKRQRNRLASDPSFKMRYAITRRMLLALKTQKQSKRCSSVKYLGCTIDELKIWLQSKFTRKMNWQNHGSYWHIDHVIPCDSFDLSVEKQAMTCFHFSNLQPLPAKENIRKGNKITEPQMSLLI